MKADVDEAKAATSRVEQSAEAALSTVVSGVSSLPAIAKGEEHGAVLARAKKYHRMRDTESSSPFRTAEMNRLFGQLLAIVPRDAHFDVVEELQSEDPGMRLAAYAHVYQDPEGEAQPPRHRHPVAELLDGLVRAVECENENFSQIWAIRAVGAVLGSTRGEIPRHLLDNLKYTRDKLDTGSDRSIELTRLIDLAREV